MILRSKLDCPCGSGVVYMSCCGRCHHGEIAAQHAEALMRSRYSAYVLGLSDYLLATWHASTRPANLHCDPACRWLGLSVKGQVPIDERNATVEFVARYKINGRACRLHELSRFVFEDRRWFYLDGILRE